MLGCVRVFRAVEEERPILRATHLEAIEVEEGVGSASLRDQNENLSSHGCDVRCSDDIRECLPKVGWRSAGVISLLLYVFFSFFLCLRRSIWVCVAERFASLQRM